MLKSNHDFLKQWTPTTSAEFREAIRLLSPLKKQKSSLISFPIYLFKKKKILQNKNCQLPSCLNMHQFPNKLASLQEVYLLVRLETADLRVSIMAYV